MDITKLSIISSVLGGHTGLLYMSDDKTHLLEFKTLTDTFKSVTGSGQSGQRDICINDQRPAS